jgi:hypothetical protein
MISDLDVILNDLLSRWHWWATQFLHGQGYYNDQPYANMAPPLHGNVWNDELANDAKRENAELAEVDHAIDAVPQPHRTALWFNARNLYTGVHVWRSPRLPADAMARAQLVVDARKLLVVELQKREVINVYEARDTLTLEAIDA